MGVRRTFCRASADLFLVQLKSPKTSARLATCACARGSHTAARDLQPLHCVRRSDGYFVYNANGGGCLAFVSSWSNYAFAWCLVTLRTNTYNTRPSLPHAHTHTYTHTLGAHTRRRITSSPQWRVSQLRGGSKKAASRVTEFMNGP